MATVKSYSDISQSKKLAEILPLESADMFWWYNHNIHTYDDIPKMLVVNNWDDDYNKNIPCWSLSALLGVLPDYTLQTNTDGTVFVVCDSKKPMISDDYDNPVDACYEMIIRLHELKML